MPISRKNEIRHAAMDRRKNQTHRDVLSRQICDHVLSLESFSNCSLPLIYMNVRTEVQTDMLIQSRLLEGKNVCIPYCVGDELELFEMTNLNQLERGKFGIPEPKRELRNDEEHRVSADEFDVAIVPGVAFDRQGNRLGYGKGYFDRLLNHAVNTLSIGLAFECQLEEDIPVDQHDVQMNMVVTEKGVYRS